MLWLQGPWADALAGLKPYHKLLAIPVLLIYFARSRHGLAAFLAFTASCTVLLAYSWASLPWPVLLVGGAMRGVPVKDTIFQGMNFLLAACVLAQLAFAAFTARRVFIATALAAVAAVFVANVLTIALSRTSIIAAPVLFAIVGFSCLRFRGMLLLGAAVIIAAGVAWGVSGKLRERTQPVVEFVLQHRAPEERSASLRWQFWQKSIETIRVHPLLGSGTGALKNLFADAKIDGERDAFVGAKNPHNQTFAIAIQVGLAGVLILWLMWFSHLGLFFGSSWAARFGLLAVAQNVLDSVVNSHLSDFTAGWLYVLAVGVLGGTVLGQRAGAAAEQGARRP
jgi:hypothetical protein